MLKILINAYACSPGLGSEPGMAWNWCVHLAQHCELHIITEGEFRQRIEAALPLLPQGEHMHFYYNPVPERVRRMCWNQGDWRFYKYYRQWQYRTYQTALEIIRTQRIDILHQLNMVGFREPGCLWKIDGIPLVWGPIAGIQHITSAYLRGTDFRFAAFFTLKNAISRMQLRLAPRIRAMVRRADAILAATPQMQQAIENAYGTSPLLVHETGCDPQTDVVRSADRDGTFHLLWVGRFLPGKQLELALETLRKAAHLNIRLHIVGEGFTEQITRHYHHYAQRIGVGELCQWHGRISNEQVLELMQSCHLFFFTSIMEATSTVVPEAIQNSLPVLCFDTCGFGPLVTPEIGIRIPLTTPRDATAAFAAKIDYLCHHRDVLEAMSAACLEKRQKLSWQRKIGEMVELYEKLANGEPSIR